MTRVIAGAAGGRRLRTPPGTGTRPTTDRVREALFSSLGDLTGARVLDLYAGSGALGLEALSRGAAEATFVERAPAVGKLIRGNLRDLELAGGRVVVADVETFLDRRPHPGDAAPYDVVFADPPYDYEVETMLDALRGWFVGTLILERSSRSAPPTWPADYTVDREKTYGETTLWYVHSP
jgi:16S rRNA (guanine966-N2)-methyltransferase